MNSISGLIEYLPGNDFIKEGTQNSIVTTNINQLQPGEIASPFLTTLRPPTHSLNPATWLSFPYPTAFYQVPYNSCKNNLFCLASSRKKWSKPKGAMLAPNKTEFHGKELICLILHGMVALMWMHTVMKHCCTWASWYASFTQRRLWISHRQI